MLLTGVVGREVVLLVEVVHPSYLNDILHLDLEMQARRLARVRIFEWEDVRCECHSTITPAVLARPS